MPNDENKGLASEAVSAYVERTLADFEKKQKEAVGLFNHRDYEEARARFQQVREECEQLTTAGDVQKKCVRCWHELR